MKTPSEVVDSEEMISRVLPLINDVAVKGLIEISDTLIIKCCNKR